MSKSTAENAVITLDKAYLLKIWAGMLLVCGLFWSIWQLDIFPRTGLAGEYLLQLPAQVLWTFWLHQLNQAFTVRLKLSRPPVSPLEITLISSIAFFSTPFTSPHFHSHGLDPFFYIWSTCQLWFYLRFGPYITRFDQHRKPAVFLPLVLAAAANAFIPCSLLDPSLLAAPSRCLCQFWGLSFLSYLVLAPVQSKMPQQKSNLVETKPGQVIIAYPAFPGLERWLKQRFGVKSQTTVRETMLVWFCLPVGIVIYLAWCNSPAVAFVDSTRSANSAVSDRQTSLEASKKQKEASIPSAAAKNLWTASSAQANVSLASALLSGLAGVAAAAALICYSKPTHLKLTRNGIQFLRRRRLFRNAGKLRPWSDIKLIDLRRPPGKTSPLSDIICFHQGNGARIELCLSALDSIEQKEALLKAIQQFAPSIQRDPRAIQALEPPADHSYTELWLQVLSAPPKRERLKPLSEGTILQDGRYSIYRTIGVGGQGQAYLSRDSEKNLDVVLKEFILPVYVEVEVRKSALEQFEHEARILMKLDHPQVVKLLDYFVEDHRAYLSLEHIEGGSLKEAVQANGPLAEARVIELGLQMCEILRYLHLLSPPVVHRDFTPDNLILRKDGLVKLIDFNVAKEAETATVGTIVGKHAYMPPEQFRGQAVAQSDLYALGASLFYLLTAKEPEPISVSSPGNLLASVSKGLDAIVRRATALELDERYRGIEEIEADLRACASS